MGATVTKRKGTKEYLLRDQIRVWPINGTGSKAEKAAADPDDSVQVVKASPGALFLIGDNGDANAIPSDLELIWVTNRDNLLFYLQNGRHEWQISENGNIEFT